MKKILIILFLVISFATHAQNYLMQNATVTTCSGHFYDSGGALGSYGSFETYQMTLCPDTPGSYVQLNFSSFAMEGEPFDFMTIYQGTGTTGAIIGRYGNISPMDCMDVIASSHASGCITITFASDGSLQYSGWDAIISCTTVPGGIIVPPTSNTVCGGANPFCADAGSLEFPNTTDGGCVADAPAVVTNNTCLASAPNPAWYYLEIGIPGNINLEIEQTTGPNNTGTGLDVDYAIWGPFTNLAATCADFTLGDCTGDHSCTGNVVDCSYSPNAIENATIPNAQVGDIYMVLITNFDGAPGYITMTQTNSGIAGSGSTNCAIVCPTVVGIDPSACATNNGAIRISGLDPTTSYVITYSDDGTPVSVSLVSNALGQITINGLDAGNYTNIVTNFSGCTLATNNITLTASSAPTVSNLSSATPICVGNDAMYNISGTPNATVTYNINGGSNTTIVLTAAGFGIITVPNVSTNTTINLISIGIPGCSTPLALSRTVVVNPPATLALASLSENRLLCINVPMVNIVYTIGSGATTANVVNLPTGLTGALTSATSFAISGTPTQIGTFNYSVQAVGLCGNSAILTGQIIVNPTPTIAGTLSVCAGQTTILSSTDIPAVLNPWVSSNLAVATVNATGTVTGVGSGTSTITFTATTGCTTTATVTVKASPSITGVFSVCEGLTTTLGSAAAPAAANPWVSSDNSVATVSTIGLVTGISPGTATITYTASNGCNATQIITVDALAVISGNLNVCEGLTTTLSSNIAPAALNPWISSNVMVATVTVTGIVTGISAGTAVITFTSLSGCDRIETITVNSAPIITGTFSICEGQATTLSCVAIPAALNPWVSSDLTVATISASGVVTGVAAGTTTITFTELNGCTSTEIITVNALAMITGTFSLCQGLTTSLSSNIASALVNPWVSSDISVATVTLTGVVSGVSAGTAIITFSGLSGCNDTETITVFALPTITGALGVCVGQNTTFSSTSAPSIVNPWISSDTAIANVDSAGIVTGVSAGTVNITYTNSNGCTNTKSITVTAIPTIVGSLSVCVGLTTTLSSASAAAAINPWISSDPLIAAVTNGGIVTGISAGTVAIIFNGIDGCSKTEILTVTTTATITGTFTICEGMNTTLSSISPPALSNPWASSDPSVATVDSSGLVTAVSTGTTVITYTSSSGCDDTKMITVNPLPIITGTISVCQGGTTTLSSASAPALINAWASSDNLVATVNNVGTVTGIAVGTASIIFTDVNGCTALQTVTINALPTVTGTFTLCEGLTTTLTCASTPVLVNPWTTSDATVAIVSTSGVVTAVSSGTANITFTALNGCTDTKAITVDTLPLITGILSVCEGQNTGLSSTSTPAVLNPWISSDPMLATVSVLGVVTGLASGTVTITFTGITGCIDTKAITIKPLPIITGILNVCVGATSTLSTTSAAAIVNPWISSDPLIATVSDSGIVTGISAGTTTITFTGLNGCTDIETITVNALPTIIGTSNVCMSFTSQLSSADAPALVNPWISSNPLIATVNSVGVVTGISLGTSTITFTNANGCSSSQMVTINAAAAISGILTVCENSTTTLSNTSIPAMGNPWGSSNSSVASIDSNGVVTGNAAGSATITFTNSNGCAMTTIVTVIATPVILGTLVVCEGSTTNLSSASTPAVVNPWISSNPVIAAVSLSGAVTAISPGTATITFTNSNGCIQTANIVVKALPTIIGNFSICEGSTTALSASSLPATLNPWVSSNVLVATVDALGIVNGISNGTSMITFTNLDGCTDTQLVTINTIPTITGSFSICQGSTTALLSTSTPNAASPWVSSNTSIATVSANGIVTGISQGTTTITFNNVNGCVDTEVITVTSLPTIGGDFSICLGLNTILSGSGNPAVMNPWTSSNNTIASINANGQVSANGVGTTTVTFTNSIGCSATQVITVNKLPVIIGNSSVCQGLATALSSLDAPAVINPWVSTNPAIASVDAAGVVSGNTVGSVTITFTNIEGCTSSKVVTVNGLPVIAGVLVVCEGYSTSLSGSPTPASINPWISSDPLIATVSSTGLVSGASAGMATITYINSDGCKSTAVVTVNATPKVIAAPTLAICSRETTNINLSSLVSGTTFSYTAIQTNVIGASSGSGNLIAQELTATSTIPGRVVYTIVPTSPLGCVGDSFVITVTVNLLPKAILSGGVICRNPTTGVVGRSYVLNAGLNNADFDFVWLIDGTVIVGAINNTYEAMQGGLYTVVATNTATGCVSDAVTATVTESEIAELAFINGNEAFADDAVISVVVIGNGNYEYQLDNGAWQTSNIFTALAVGTHEIHVRDADDCTDITQEFTVIGYPKFFTPNADGYNDTWNIWTLSNQPTSKIYIYDRYGKLIKEISPAGDGWNGSFNGRELPSTDYWFTVDYLQPDSGLSKQFKSHFSLKR